MFVGHYALGYYLKAKNNYVPLWLIFLGVQFVDLLWAVSIFFGIERASFDPEASSVFLRAIYEYYPYTHSLFTSISIAFLSAFVVYKLFNKKWAMVTGIAVLSHWFLDLIVHVPDVPLFFNSYKVGFGIWNYPVTTLFLEVIFLTVGLWYFIKSEENIRTRKWAIGIYFFLTIFYIGSFFAPAVPPTPIQIGIFGVLIYGGVAVAAYLAEKSKRGTTKE
ncbi:MAG: hypothetical protein K9M10_01685 [Candidatus Pacebacteria bacterium]|nr:hypothetical protein [Candidatus Paceibacterota bacterium]MCF7857174.1 hypothetical protein [Candidatus Paceibacterota bacterium]